MSDENVIDVNNIRYTVVDISNYTASVSALNGDLSNNLNVTFITSYTVDEITYPVYVISVDESGFEGTMLKSIVIPASVTEIGDNAFRDCIDLTSVTFESNTTLLNVGSYAFAGCISLSSITLPSCVETLGEYVFQGCPLTNQTDNIPPGISVLPAGFFSSPTLTTVVLPPTITSVAANTFDGCTNLTSVRLSDNITSLDWGAFSSCANMTFLTISTSTVLSNYVSGSGLDNQTGLGTLGSFIVLRGLSGSLVQSDLNSYISSLTNGTVYIYSGFVAPTTGANVVTIPVLPPNKNNVLVFGSTGVSANNYSSASFGSSNPNNVRQSNGGGMKPLVVVVEYPNKYAIIQ